MTARESETAPPTRLSVRIDSYSYPDGTNALSAMALDIREGEFSGVLGSNGSGKTTLLKVMDGLMKDFKGSVLLDGVDIRKLSPKEIYRKVGLVFQNPDDQLFASTVSEDVAFGPTNMGFSEQDVADRVRNVLACSGNVRLCKEINPQSQLRTEEEDLHRRSPCHGR